MAAPITVRSTSSCFKRLRISSVPSRSQQTASFTSSSRLSDTENANSSQESSQNSDVHTAESAAPTRVSRTPMPSQAEIWSGIQEGDKKRFPQAVMRNTLFKMAEARGIEVPKNLFPVADHQARMPRNVQALYLAPLQRKKPSKVVSGTLKIRSYSVRNLETMADFAMRAAYYLNLAARMTIPPRITERWTVPRSVFVHKKAQENWERITSQRLITIYGGHPDVIRLWLTFVRKWQWYGVGFRAEVYEDEGVDDWKLMGTSDAEIQAAEESTKWWLFGRRHDLAGKDAIGEFMDSLGHAKGPSRSSQLSTVMDAAVSAVQAEVDDVRSQIPASK